MTALKKHALVIALSAAALALGAYLGWRHAQPGAPPPATLAQIELPDLDKRLRRGEEWLGKVVVLNHWATWCPPCREEIPLLMDYQRRHAGRGVQIIGIAHDLLDAARAFSDSIGMNYPSLVAITGGNQLMRQQGNDTAGALPFTAFFDRHGNLAATQLGLLTEARMDAIIAPLL